MTKDVDMFRTQNLADYTGPQSKFSFNEQKFCELSTNRVNGEGCCVIKQQHCHHITDACVDPFCIICFKQSDNGLPAGITSF